MRTVLALALLGVVAAGCDSTRDKAARIAEQGSDAFEAQGLSVASAARNVTVGDSTVITDANGTVAVVELTAKGARPLAKVPLALTVKDTAGKPVFKNDVAGLEEGLVAAPLLEPGKPFLWVNDQVLPVGGGEPSTAEVVPGQGEPVSGELPEMTLSAPEIREDPVSGVAAAGEVTNGADADQVNLVIFGVAKRSGRIVAAGRGVIPRLRAKAKTRYQVFFIGDPRGAEISLEAPATGVAK